MGKFVTFPKTKYQTSYKIVIFTNNICKVSVRITKQAPERKQATTTQHLQWDKHRGCSGHIIQTLQNEFEFHFGQALKMLCIPTPDLEVFKCGLIGQNPKCTLKTEFLDWINN